MPERQLAFRRTSPDAASADGRKSADAARPNAVLALQRTIGNRATQRVLARRLTVKPDQLPVERDDTRRTQIKLIRQTLEGYETSRTAAERIPVLQYMQSIIKAWHDAGGQATSIGGQWLSACSRRSRPISMR